jgi:hypothetical protein
LAVLGHRTLPGGSIDRGLQQAPFASRRQIHLGYLLLAAMLAGSSAASAQPLAALASGVDLGARDLRVRPGDDFFQYALGGWYAATPIPPDQSEVGADSEVSAKVREQLRALRQTPGGVA